MAKKVVKTQLHLKDVTKELSSIAQGQCKNPFEAELRIKALRALADVLLREKAIGVEDKQKVKSVTIQVVSPDNSQKRLKAIEEDLLAQASKDGEV